jgi:hypothetical protein
LGMMTMINSRKIEDLLLTTATKCRAFIDGCASFIRYGWYQSCKEPVPLGLVAGQAKDVEVALCISATLRYRKDVVNTQLCWGEYDAAKVTSKSLFRAHCEKVGFTHRCGYSCFLLNTHLLHIFGIVRALVLACFIAVGSGPFFVVEEPNGEIHEVVLPVSTLLSAGLYIWVEYIWHKILVAHHAFSCHRRYPSRLIPRPSSGIALHRAVLWLASTFPFCTPRAKQNSAAATFDTAGGYCAI